MHDALEKARGEEMNKTEKYVSKGLTEGLNFAMEISDFSWQHQKYARPEIYVVTYVWLILSILFPVPKNVLIKNFAIFILF